MDNFAADFTINNNSLQADYELGEGQHLDCLFELYAAGTVWGSIDGTLSNQTDLQNALDAKQDVLTAGEGISIENNVISSTQTSAEWGNIEGTLSDQTDLQNELNGLSDGITANHDEIGRIGQLIGTYGDIVTYDASDFATSAQGALADTALQSGDNITELVNNAGYITGINSTDVTNALGYTPYDASNPDGFITGIDSTDVTTALGYTPYDASNPAGYITSASLPTNYVTTDTAQTISVSKAFSQPIVMADNNGLASGTLLSNKKILQRTSGDSTLTLNNIDNKLRLVGSETRPKYSADGTNFTDLALSSDITSYTAGTGIDITSNTISVTSPTVTNNATGTNALAIGNTSQSTAEGGVAVGDGARANSTYSTAVGQNTRATNTNTTVIGRAAKATEARAIAIGSGAEANAQDAIAIKGVNNTANTFQVYTYNMLDMSTGLIPDARISTNIARTTDIPTVNDATLTIQKNGTDVQTFTANASSNVTCNITVPTDTSDLTNGAGYITASSIPTDYYTKSEIDSLIPQPTKVPIVYYQPTDSYCYNESNNRFYGSHVTEKLYLAQPKTSGTTQVIDMSTTFALSFTIDYKEAPSSSITLAEIMTSYSAGKGVLLQLSSSGLYYKNNVNGTTISGTRTLTVGNSYDIKVEYDGTHMIISYKLSSDLNYTQANSTTCTADGSNYNYAAINMDTGYGNISLSSVTLTNGGNTLYSYTAGKIALDYDSSLTLNASNQLKVVVDQTYNALSTNPQSGIAIASAIPTVNDATITITQGGVTKGSFTLNQSSNQTIALDAGGGGSITEVFVATYGTTTLAEIETAVNANKVVICYYDDYVYFLNTITKDGNNDVIGFDFLNVIYTQTNNIQWINVDDSNVWDNGSTTHLTPNTTTTIWGTFTFQGEKKIKFKQSTSNDKLGFTLYNSSSTELGAFEYRPNTISGSAFLNINCPYSADYVGFRYWGTAVNIIAPKVGTAGDYYIPVNITDGNTTVTANSTGTVNISSLLPNVSGYLQNTATGTDSLTVLGTASTGDGCINIGVGSQTSYDAAIAIGAEYDLDNGASASDYSIAIGTGANASASYSVAIGAKSSATNVSGTAIALGSNSLASGEDSIALGKFAEATAREAYQIGEGTNNTANSLQVGSRQLLDITTGLIPDARLSSNIARTSQIPNLNGYVQNIATGVSSLTILGTPTNNVDAINIGINSVVTGSFAVSIGLNAEASGNHSTALGEYTTSYGEHSLALGAGAKTANCNYSIQLGYGTNSEQSTLSVGFYNSGSAPNYKLLDGTTGLIPDARLSSNIARTSQIPTVPTTVSSFTNDAGYITGINSSDVTTALGYTPADNTLSNVSSIDGNSAVKTALDAKVNTADVWYDSTTSTLNIGVAQV